MDQMKQNDILLKYENFIKATDKYVKMMGDTICQGVELVNQSIKSKSFSKEQFRLSFSKQIELQHMILAQVIYRLAYCTIFPKNFMFSLLNYLLSDLIVYYIQKNTNKPPMPYLSMIIQFVLAVAISYSLWLNNKFFIITVSTFKAGAINYAVRIFNYVVFVKQQNLMK